MSGQGGEGFGALDPRFRSGLFRSGFGALSEQAIEARAARLGIPKNDFQCMLDHEFHSLGDAYFNEANFIASLAVGAVGQQVVSFRLPVGMLGILRAVAFALDNAADFDNVRWAVTVNGDALLGLDNIIGPISSLLFPLPLMYPMYKDATVAILATNLSAAVITNVTGLVRGTFFPSDVSPE